MDAAIAAFKKTALVLSLALLAAMPRLAQATTPAFTSPTSSTVVTLVNKVGVVNVSGSQDTATPPQTITFTVSVAYTSGDQPWLEVGGDSSGPTGCTGGSSPYTTTASGLPLPMGVACLGGDLSPGTHTATVTLNPVSPAGVTAVTFTVNYNTAGTGGATLVATPANLTGSNALSAGVGAQTTTTVSLETTSTTAVSFTTTSGASWLTVTPNVTQVTSSAPATLTITASAAALTVAGSPYTTTATVSYGGQQLIISVTFNVGQSPVALNPVSLAWTDTSGALSPSSPLQNVTLTTSNSDSYTAVVSYPHGATATNWLLVDNVTTVPGLGNGSTLVVSLVSYSSLAAGTYTGTITVTDTGNAANTASLNVTLTVAGASSGNLTITPSPITLNSANNYGQSVTVSSAAGGTFAASASSSGNWLGVSTSSGSIAVNGSGYLTVTANTNVSGSGTFTGTITVTVGTVSQQVTVNLTAGGGASGSTSPYVAPLTLNFVGQSGGADLTQQILFVGNGGFQISSSPTYSTNSNSVGWFESSEFAGNMSAQGTAVTLYANPKQLAGGTYTATVPLGLVVNGEALNPSPTLSVNFVVSSGSVLAASPGTVIFNNGGTAPNTTVSVSTTSSTPLSLGVTTDQAWLSATPQTGTTPATISVTANTSGLAGGLYSGNVVVSSASTPPLYVPVILVVSAAINPSGLTLSSPSLTFAAQVGGSAPSSQTLTVSSSPAGTAFSATASVTTPTGGTWLSVSPATNLTTNQALTVSVNQSGLATGTYTGNIALSANGATLNVPVTLVVNTTGTTGGNVTVSASKLTFSALAGGAAPTSQTLTVSSAAGSAGVAFTAVASSTGNWLSVSPTSGSTQATLTVAVNQASLAVGSHSGSITITPTGGTAVVVTVTLTVVAEPSISVSPGLLSFAFQAGSGGIVSPGQLTVTALGGTASFQASASSEGNWLSVTPLSGSTSTTAILTVQVNPAGLAASETPYTGTIMITGESGTEGSFTVDVSLSVTAPLPSITAVLNAASFLNGPVSPGEIVSIFGTSIGPTNPSTLTLNSAGQVSTSLGGVEVSFSGHLAPLTYVSATQINAVVPYELSGNKAPFVEVIFAGQTSNEPSVQLTTTAPGIFTQNGQGNGTGAILNQDYSVNTQAKPAAIGSVVQIFMTGEGLTTPAQATGTITPVNTSGVGPVTPAPQLAVSVMIGNQPAQLEFAGEAPGIVAGVLQVNAYIPATASSGANPITVQVGKNISQPGVTVWVQ